MFNMIIALSFESITKPTLEITDNGIDQVVIRFIPYGDEHVTIHKEENGNFVVTHFSSNKEKSIWDDTRIKVARNLQIPNPERHGNYYYNSPLPMIENADGYHLMGRLIDLDSFNPRAKYQNNIDRTFSVQMKKFMLTIFFSTFENPRNEKEDVVNTILGNIYLNIKLPYNIRI